MFQPLIFRGVSHHFFLYVFVDIIGLLNRFWCLPQNCIRSYSPFSWSSLLKRIPWTVMLSKSFFNEQCHESSFALVFLTCFFLAISPSSYFFCCLSRDGFPPWYVQKSMTTPNAPPPCHGSTRFEIKWTSQVELKSAEAPPHVKIVTPNQALNYPDMWWLITPMDIYSISFLFIAICGSIHGIKLPMYIITDQ